MREDKTRIEIQYKVIAKMEEPIINDKQTYRPLYEKKAVVVSQTGSKINFNISRK